MQERKALIARGEKIASMADLASNRVVMIKATAALGQSIETYERYRNNEDQVLQSMCVVSVVKHFELCFYMSVKYFVSYLSEQYNIEAASDRQIWRVLHDVGLINTSDLESLLACSKLHRMTSRIVDKEFARELCKEIVKIYPNLKIIIDGVVAR